VIQEHGFGIESRKLQALETYHIKKHSMSKQRNPVKKTETGEKPGIEEKSAPGVKSKSNSKSNSHKKRRRRSFYKKTSDKIFTSTGMPLSRLLSIAIGFLLIGGLIFYIVYQGDESLPSSTDAPTSQFESGESDEYDFMRAVTIPTDFSKSSLPVQIERVDWMIQRCNYLLNQKSDYSEKIEEKLLALCGLKTAIIAQSGMDPAPHLELLKKQTLQLSSSSTDGDKHQYLVVVSYLTALAALPAAEIYDDAIEAISGIQESTPVPPSTAISCYNSCLKFYVNSADKNSAGNLLRVMGEKLRISGSKRLSDLGLTLLDYPNFSYYYQDSFNQAKSGTKFEAETLQLLEQIRQTPPQSTQTFDLLLTVPEQYLQVGNTMVAQKVVDQLTSAASESNPETRDNVLAKIEKQTTRIKLLGKKFPVSGVDVTGTKIGPPKKDTILIIFWDPDGSSSTDALVRISDSRLYDRWSTSMFLVSVSELTVEEIVSLKKRYSEFRVVDGSTAIQWMKKSGVNEVPYLITLDKTGTVQRLSTP